MKKATAWLLSLLFILSPLCLCASAASTDNTGLNFSANATYPVSKTYEESPQSITAWIKLDKNLSGRAGVILGNYGIATPCLNFEITDNGVPRLYYVDPDKTVHDFKFTKADVRTGDWVHIAFVHDEASKTSYFYLNGVLVDSVQNNPRLFRQGK